MSNKCQCKKILGREKIWVHLNSCPKGDYTKEYNEMPWYKKIFKKSPQEIYNYYLRT